jgi:hypothetical protein
MRDDDLGECFLCKVPRVLIDGPPEGWDVFIQEESRNNCKAPRSQWAIYLENKPEEERCPHEKVWIRRNKADKIGGRA